MSSYPLVTVIIPSFNHARWVGNAVESVLAQSYTNIELIVVDDGSTDESPGVLSNCKRDPRVRIILNKENKGQSFVINQALSLCGGDLICILPSDDWFLPNKIEAQVEKFRNVRDEVGVIYSLGLRYFEDINYTFPVNLPLYRGNILKKLILRGNFIYPVTPMFRRECFSRVPMDESYKAEGEAIYVKIARYFKFDYVDDVLAVMRDHTYNTGKNRVLMYNDNIRWWSNFFDDETLPADILKLRGVPLGRTHRMMGLELLRIENNPSEALRALRAAVKFRPSYVLDWKVVVGMLLCFLKGGTVSEI